MSLKRGCGTLGQTAIKAGSVASAAASGSHWWTKLGAGSKSGITIKTSDGQDVTSLIENVVEKTVSHHRKDDLARVDYALNSGGAGVIPSLTSETYYFKKSHFWGLFTGAAQYARSPVTALHHETHLGHCWPFFGSKGQLGVLLASPVHITDITIDHVPSDLAHDMRSAPRHMEVWGLLDGRENKEKYAVFEARREQLRSDGIDVPEEPTYPKTLPKTRDVRYVRVGTFEYDIRSPHPIQTFSIAEDIKDLGLDFGLVVLMINDNWGHKEFTCLYRFRVHGERSLDLSSPDL